ncbi:MAG: hypothetical protein SOZ34_12025, partial [Clostridia bacterium]|nr:hypothetical protein [Clostridia bacterium]
KNVAVNKTANFKTAIEYTGTNADNAAKVGTVGTYNPTFTNNYFGAGDNYWSPLSNLPKDNPLLIDLGNKYEVIGVAWCGNFNWHTWELKFYAQNDASYDTEGKTENYTTPNSGSSLFGTGAFTYAEGADTSSRYILIKSPDNDRYVLEFAIYAYVDAEKPDIYYTSPITLDDSVQVTTVYANAKNAGTDTLILAEYDGTTLVNVQVTDCVSGSATLSIKPTEGHTYKTFLWDTLSGLKPKTASIQY